MGNWRDAAGMMQCDLPGWVIKDTAASSLLSLASFTLREATPRVVKTLKQPSGEVCVMRGSGLPIFYYLLEFAQINVHWVGDAI